MLSRWRPLLAAALICLAAPAVVPAAAHAGSPLFADLSGYNENVDLGAYKAAGHNIVALKSTEGSNFRSDAFAPRFRQAGRLHMIRLVYHYVRPSRGPPEAEARYWAAALKAAGWRAGDIAVIDFEDPGQDGPHVDGWVVRFIRQATREGIHVAVLYSYGPYASTRLSSTVGLYYWHAAYLSNPLSTVPAFARRKVVAVQFTDGIYGGQPHYLPGMGSLGGSRHGDVNRRLVPEAQFARIGILPTPTVRGGDRGPKVKWVVDRLMYLGYLPYPKLGRPRSVFGGWVNTAVAHFKRDYHLPATPVVDAPTREAIAHAVNARKAQHYKPPARPPLRAPVRHATTLGLKAEAAATAPVAVKAPKPVAHCLYRVPLHSGNGGRDVAVLRVRLVELGLAPKSQTGHAGRYFGRGTRLSVQRFQRLRHLPADGVVGPRTLRAMGMSVCKPTVAQLRVTVALDGTPTYRGLALAIQDARAHGAGGSLNSGDRRPGVAERYGKLSQAFLFRCYRARGAIAGCPHPSNPANPPGFSTHEQRSDGFAYNVTRGAKLKWWQLGNDVGNSQTYVVVLRRLGYCVRRPYSDSREFHHLNFCADPTPVLRRHRLAR